MICVNCNKKTARITKERYFYLEGGFGDVTLTGVDFYVCASCYENYICIPQLNELHDHLESLRIYTNDPITATYYPDDKCWVCETNAIKEQNGTR